VIIHKLIELYLKDKKWLNPLDIPELSSEVATLLAGSKKLFWQDCSYQEAIENLMPDLQVIETEKTVYNDEVLYAGRTDLIAEYKGKMSVIDFKSGKSVDMRQLAAYAACLDGIKNLIIVTCGKTDTKCGFVKPIICTYIDKYFKEFLDGMMPPTEFSWIEMDKDESLSDTLLINRSMKPMSEQTTTIYQNVLNEFPKKAFICFDEEQYNNFTLKDQCETIKVDSLYEFFKKINGSKLFIGNQSGPMAWATSMNISRGIELLATIDNAHYIKDKEYYSQFDYFQGDNT
jgi:hypothetical protein